MIILFNPRSTRPRNRRLPLSVLALGAVLQDREEYEIVDGNLDENPTATILRLIAERDVEMLGVTVMPGPQMAAAVESCKEIRARHPKLTIVWGGYFGSIYTDAALNAKYVDYVVRGQGEDTRLELVQHLESRSSVDLIPGIGFKRGGKLIFTTERPLKPLVDMPASKLRKGIAQVLKDEGYIWDFEELETVPSKTLRLQMKYGPNGERLITKIEITPYARGTVSLAGAA